MATSSDVAFTTSVKTIQARRGPRPAHARVEADGGWETEVTAELAAFLAEQESVILATATTQGQPYAQHRGGPKGFVRVLDDKTLAFADYRGNRQYITQGNLAENPQAFIIAIDYLRRRRIKIWGRARVVEDNAPLITQLLPQSYRAKAEQAILFEVAAWCANCPSHIPQMLPAGDSPRQSPACSSAFKSLRPRTRPCALPAHPARPAHPPDRIARLRGPHSSR